MVGRVGVPELVIIMFISLFSIIPIVIAGWLIVNVVRLRTSVTALQNRLDALERGARQS